MNYIQITEIAGSVVGFFIFVKILVSIISLRRVVPTNEVHIVQRGNSTTSYGTSNSANGNIYYEYPGWLPRLGVSKIVLPVSVFKLELDSYDAYDKNRLPFEIDVVAFFRINDSNMAAQRVSTVRELEEQLLFIVKGAARTVLASYEIDEIMVERAKFGEHFTSEVEGQLKNWGVETVKSIELMDIRDAHGSKVIANIMAKQSSLIEAQSRTEVAKNMQAAQTSEVIANQEISLRQQEAEQAVGQRSAEAQKQVGLTTEKAKQEVEEQKRLTKEKEMAVLQVATVKQAEISKAAGVVAAEQDRDVAMLTKEANITKAEQEKAVIELNAAANLASQENIAKATKLNGDARASAEQALLMAPVNAQIALAEKIGSDEKYQQYLITVRQIEAHQAIGIANAANLSKAEIKVIANTGTSAQDGLKSVADLISPKGGFNLGAMLETFGATEAGKAVIEKFIPTKKGE